MSKLVSVLFLEDRTVNAVDGATFKKGEIYDLPVTSAVRWEIRGAARRATPDEVRAARTPKPIAAPQSSEAEKAAADAKAAAEREAAEKEAAEKAASDAAAKEAAALAAEKAAGDKAASGKRGKN